VVLTFAFVGDILKFHHFSVVLFFLFFSKKDQHLFVCSSLMHFFLFMFSCHSNVVPDVMINTEVWVPPGYKYDNWIDSQLVSDAGTISSHGRYKWHVSYLKNTCTCQGAYCFGQWQGYFHICADLFVSFLRKVPPNTDVFLQRLRL